MEKETIGIMFGGPSSEYKVALDTVDCVLKLIDRSRYDIVLVGVNRSGKAYVYLGDEACILDDTWEDQETYPAFFSIDPQDTCVYYAQNGSLTSLHVDRFFPIMHGAFGEDGTAQGLLKAAGFPIVGCGITPSALGMDKDLAHKVARAAGISVARSIVVRNTDSDSDILRSARQLEYPVYVKPARGGSSIGITKVVSEDGLIDAVALARSYDEKVVIEENIDGIEVGLAIIGKDRLITGEVDSLATRNDFFSYEDKYLSSVSKIAQDKLPDAARERIANVAVNVYRALECDGFARVDLFLTEDGTVYFNEINTIPWIPEHGRFAQMLIKKGLSMPQIVQAILDV